MSEHDHEFDATICDSTMRYETVRVVLASEHRRICEYAEQFRNPPDEALFEIGRAIDEEVSAKAPAADLATIRANYLRAWKRIVAKIDAALAKNPPSPNVDCWAARSQGGTGPICDMCNTGYPERCRWLAKNPIPSGSNPSSASHSADTVSGPVGLGPTDTSRLNSLEAMLAACPHAIITFNDDDDRHDADGPVPLGYSIRIDGCEPLSVAAPTLREALDAVNEHPDSEGENPPPVLSQFKVTEGK